MKVLFFTMHMARGGAERVISTLCNGAFGKCCEPYILTVIKGKSDYELSRHVKLYGLIAQENYLHKGKIKTLPEACRKYYAFVKKRKPDIIICFLPEPCFIAGLYREKLGIPIIGSERGNPDDEFKNPLYRIAGNWLYAKADGFVFQTEGARDFFCSRVRGKSAIIGNPVAYEKLPDVPVAERKKEIVAVGRFAPEKNYPLLIRAFAKAVKCRPGYKLRIFGRYREDDEAVQLIHRLGLSGHVFLEGEVENVREKIYRSYAYVLTSLSEGMPNALMEAMAAGMPVIASDCPSGGPAALIKNGVNGLLFENGNEDAAARAIIRLIDSPQLAERLGAQAGKIQDEYAEAKIADMWTRYIRKAGNLQMEGEESVFRSL